MRRHWLTLLSVFLLASRVAPAQGPAEKLSGEGVTTDVVYGHKAGMALTFDIYRPARPNGAAVVSIVSGGWAFELGHDETISRTAVRVVSAVDRSRSRPGRRHSSVAQLPNLMQKGYTVFAVRHGSSPNFNMPEIVGDVRRAVRFIRAHAYGWVSIPNESAYGEAAQADTCRCCWPRPPRSATRSRPTSTIAGPPDWRPSLPMPRRRICRRSPSSGSRTRRDSPRSAI